MWLEWASSISLDSWLAFIDRRDSTVHEQAEIVVALCSVLASSDICITVEPLERLFKWRELSYHHSLDGLLLIRIEHLARTVACEYVDILGVDRRRDLPVTLEPRSVLHRLADINKIAGHGMYFLSSLAAIVQPPVMGDSSPSRGLTLQCGESAD
jgi:hypothetical protein